MNTNRQVPGFYPVPLKAAGVALTSRKLLRAGDGQGEPAAFPCAAAAGASARLSWGAAGRAALVMHSLLLGNLPLPSACCVLWCWVRLGGFARLWRTGRAAAEQGAGWALECTMTLLGFGGSSSFFLDCAVRLICASRQFPFHKCMKCVSV